MLGGGLMLILGLLFMLLVIGLPILLILAAVAGIWGLPGRHNETAPASPSYSGSAKPELAFPRYCSHCGQGLQTDWTHCPNCGASVENQG